MGNRLSEVTEAGTAGYEYDHANRLMSVNGVSYTWDNNGNLLNDRVSTYTYNHANRLTSLTTGGVTYTYAYNGLGDRVSQTVGGVTKRYTLDLNAGLTQVLSDGTNTYLYGNERIAQYTGTAPSYFLGDALNSVRQLTDASGAVTLAKTYKPFGEVLNSTGSGTSIFAFDGEQTDSYIKLIYLRSRMYSPETGRFLSKDTWQGDYNTPMSYNAWIFVYANPINWADPSGYCQGQGCTEPTPTPPGYTSPAPVFKPVPVPPGQKVGEPSSLDPYDGYLFGSATMSTFWGYTPLSEKDKLKKSIGLDCNTWFWPNGTITGQETVYDFKHLQKSVFTYTGIINITYSLAEVEGIAYEGIAKGFANSESIGDYAGYSMGMGLSFSPGNLIEAGLNINLPISRSASLVKGISSITWDIGAGAGIALSMAIPWEGTVSISKYTEVPNKQVEFKKNVDRSSAVWAMANDIRGLPTTPGKSLALMILSDWIKDR